jgi:membrane protease subunit HflK
MEQVLRDSNKIVIDKQAGSQGVVPYLPLNELHRAPVQAPAAPPAAAGSARR